MHPIYKFNSMALQFTIFESKLANLCHTIFPIRNMKFIFLFNLADLCVDVVVAFHVNYCERCQTFCYQCVWNLRNKSTAAVETSGQGSRKPGPSIGRRTQDIVGWVSSFLPRFPRYPSKWQSSRSQAADAHKHRYR